MSLPVIATYAVLVCVIFYLLKLLAAKERECRVEVRDTVLAPEELHKHAIEMARDHPVGKSARSLHWLVKRLNDNYGKIAGVYKALNADVRDSLPTAPAAEWLLDNFYIIEEQVRLIRRNLSKGQYSRLPVLKKGYLKGYPRVYAIALELVAHSDGSVDEKLLTGFIEAYQSQVLLSMGELWAVPLMLKIALIESIRNICGKIDETRKEWRRAEALAASIASYRTDEKRIEHILKEQLSATVDISPSFVEHLLQKLRKTGNGLSVATLLLDQYLRRENYSTREMTLLEHQLQASMQVSIGNSITGLRLISDMDWSEIFESLSKVEHILRQDPGGVYARMDFESRDYYRHEIEKLARSFGTTEINVADKAVECARKAPNESPRDHVGYYLIGKGRRKLENMIGRSADSKRGAFRMPAVKPLFIYLGLITALTVFTVSFLAYYAGTHGGIGATTGPILAALLTLIPASELSVNLVNTLMSHIYRPTMLPKLELKDGIPPEFSTFVIIPTLMPDAGRVREMLLDLEVYYLANRDPNLYFALVGDFRDAPSGVMESDSTITAAALDGIHALNRKYAENGHDIFYFLSRKRLYNESQGRWMGWERKRGAIIEFNRLLRGEMNTTFETVSGDISAAGNIKYVITLDADTNLPMSAAKRLIGTIAHPLNRAVVDESTGLVREGHGLLQPRISVGIHSANRSMFTRIFAGQGGIDPYTTAVSDIYQDIFDEGIFTGKGIYEVDVFQKVLADRIPDNSVLSHDLIEGCHLRAGLVSDIELVDGYPTRYNSYAARQHRWTRGDWQLLPWLGRNVRDKSGKKVRNRLSCISRWKILDNLRRSLLYPSLLLLFIAGLVVLPGSQLLWTGLAILVTATPLATGIFDSLLAGGLQFGRGKTNATIITGIKAACYQSILLLAFLPHQAFLMADAIVRTVGRVCITHRNMLEWVTAADVEAGSKNSPGSFFRKMWFTYPAAVITLVFAAANTGDGIFTALPAAILWILAPWTAYWVSKPIEKKRSRLPESDMDMLRLAARKTWRFFEDFAVESENYLPPDNFQLDPPKGVAHRTSPTNIGLLLISVMSAGDLGYAGFIEVGDRLDKILTTVEKLDKWEGHLYNWYNTITLEMLRPLYVSTVDSGNLVGYMMTVAEGLEEYLHRQAPQPAMALGVRDTLALACDEMGEAPETSLMQLFGEIGCADSMDLRKWAFALRKLDEWLKTMEPSAQGKKKNRVWTEKLSKMKESCLQELEAFYPAFAPDMEGFTDKLEPALAAELFAPAALDELPARWRNIARQLETAPAVLTGISSGAASKPLPDGLSGAVSGALPGMASDTAPGALPIAKTPADLLIQAAERVETLCGKYRELIGRLKRLAEETKFRPLFDCKRMLFSIGFNVEDGHLGKSYYDLLASEARQASYIAVARGEVDRRHWARLGRKLTAADGGKGLVSWTGTMFEYLMPYLILKNYENTLFDETYSFVIKVQMKYAKQRGIPWGISESGYSAYDMNLNYKYKAFGVPELGLKRGLANDMVISPYSAMLALPLSPENAVANLKGLSQMGMDGDWGYYEAVDFTPSRLDRDIRYKIVKSFMAHHQGMSLAALNNFINAGILQKRFHSNPVIKAAELLLQEKSPERAVYKKEYREEAATCAWKIEQYDGEAVREFGAPAVLPPNVHILSNGTYSVMVTDSGSGYSRNGETAVNRWCGDYYRNDGFYIFVQNINSNDVWSATYGPLRNKPEKYRVVFSPDKAEFSRKDGNLETGMAVAVSPEDDAEVRKVAITNHSKHYRVVELTSYFEAVLAPPWEDSAHPAFSKLFISTSFIKEHGCLLAARRSRKEDGKQLWLVHTVAVDGDAAIGDLQFETDRLKFIGRNRNISDPAALDPDQPLSNSEGSVLDPIMSLRRRIGIEPGHTVRVSFTAAVAQSKKQALELAEKYKDFKNTERVFELSWTRSQVEARYLGLDPRDAEFYLDIASLLLYGNPLRRTYAEYLLENTGAQPDLWHFGVSGDLPVVLVEVNDEDDTDMVSWAIKAHEYWRMKGLIIDLVILINRKEGYSQTLAEQVQNIVAASHAGELVDSRGGVYIRNSAVMDESQIALFYTVAALVIKDGVEALKNSVKEMRKAQALCKNAMSGQKSADGRNTQENPECNDNRTMRVSFLHKNGQADRKDSPHKDMQVLLGNAPYKNDHAISARNIASERKLRFFNGIGGFSEDGREYVIHLEKGQYTPVPWSNIIANRNFGFLVTESGGGYSWAGNSREFKLTPWCNDPVTDRQGEIFYIRDVEDNLYWSLTPMPAGDGEPYIIRHGFGYSVFEHISRGLDQTLTMFVAADRQVKINIIMLTNLTGKVRELNITQYIRPVLGVDDEKTARYIATEHAGSGLLLIRNKYSHEFKGKLAYISTNAAEYAVSGDRTSFFGYEGNAAEPLSVINGELSGPTGAGLDPCAAISAKVCLKPGEKTTLVFLLGSASSPEEAAETAAQFGDPAEAEKELAAVKQFWRDKLEAIQVSTPDDSLNTIMNGWLLYQTVSCRLWARTAYYQAGGAFGFRDQLQDCMAVLNIWPELARQQILLHASRQFREGDVQHWWHAETGKGIRTRFSDDLLWLPYVTAEYLEKTGDYAILDEHVSFIEGNTLADGENEKYEEAVVSKSGACLYEHCVLTIDRSLATGRHNLPLMGCGDWNDGMNLVGVGGEGESVWLAWFLISILNRFIPVCKIKGDTARAEKYAETAARLVESTEKEAWDGSWYRRAYFDDGTPLGSVHNSECRIDSIAQSWAVISGAARPQRMREAMEAVRKYLVDDGEGIIKLLTPPFDEGPLHPGYIKGYVPGVRENGGQYTHAAVWTVLAFAELGMGDKACELFHMLNPINHTRTPIEYSRYKCEPYVVAADVYAVHPHTGRGGWSWYTGAAGWMYRTGLESIAGFRKKGDKLYIDPCIPAVWDRFEVIYNFGRTRWSIEIRNPDKVCRGVAHVSVDGRPSRDGFVNLTDDGANHRVEVVLGHMRTQRQYSGVDSWSHA